MARQNRVQPTCDILAHPARGRFMGNRGILHDTSGNLTHQRWRHKAWVCCVLEFKNRHRPLMRPGRYTELFFHDEAVALAAGHRPCGECRRVDFNAFLRAACHHGKVGQFDAVLHAARAIPRRFEQRRHQANFADLPQGAFVLHQNAPALLWNNHLHGFSPAGYAPATALPHGLATVLTPKPTLRALRNGYTPDVALS